MDWDDLVPHLRGVASLATVTAAGRPHVALVHPVVDGGSIWISSFADAKKVRNVRANPWASLVYAPQGEAYVDGRAAVVADLAERERLWDVWTIDLAAFFERFDHPNYLLLRVTPERASLRVVGAAGIELHRWRAGV